MKRIHSIIYGIIFTATITPLMYGANYHPDEELMAGIQNDDISKVINSIENGAHINGDLANFNPLFNLRPLHIAVKNNFAHMVELLLQYFPNDLKTDNHNKNP